MASGVGLQLDHQNRMIPIVIQTFNIVQITVFKRGYLLGVLFSLHRQSVVAIYFGIKI